MKSTEFIATIRKGNSTGTVEITIPPKFYRMNGMVLGKDYLFKVKEAEE